MSLSTLHTKNPKQGQLFSADSGKRLCEYAVVPETKLEAWLHGRDAGCVGTYNTYEHALELRQTLKEGCLREVLAVPEVNCCWFYRKSGHETCKYGDDCHYGDNCKHRGGCLHGDECKRTHAIVLPLPRNVLVAVFTHDALVSRSDQGLPGNTLSDELVQLLGELEQEFIKEFSPRTVKATLPSYAKVANSAKPKKKAKKPTINPSSSFADSLQQKQALIAASVDVLEKKIAGLQQKLENMYLERKLMDEYNKFIQARKSASGEENAPKESAPEDDVPVDDISDASWASFN